MPFKICSSWLIDYQLKFRYFSYMVNCFFSVYKLFSCDKCSMVKIMAHAEQIRCYFWDTLCMSFNILKKSFLLIFIYIWNFIYIFLVFSHIIFIQKVTAFIITETLERGTRFCVLSANLFLAGKFASRKRRIYILTYC